MRYPGLYECLSRNILGHLVNLLQCSKLLTFTFVFFSLALFQYSLFLSVIIGAQVFVIGITAVYKYEVRLTIYRGIQHDFLQPKYSRKLCRGQKSAKIPIFHRYVAVSETTAFHPNWLIILMGSEKKGSFPPVSPSLTSEKIKANCDPVMQRVRA